MEQELYNSSPFTLRTDKRNDKQKLFCSYIKYKMTLAFMQIQTRLLLNPMEISYAIKHHWVAELKCETY